MEDKNKKDEIIIKQTPPPTPEMVREWMKAIIEKREFYKKYGKKQQ